MYKTKGISRNTALALIMFALTASDIALAEFAEEPPAYIRQWTVSSPSGAAFDFLGKIYVVDRSHKLVKKSDSQGMPITEWVSCGEDNPSQCYVPYDIAFDSHGNVYVIDANGIAKFDQDGKFLKQFGFKSSFVSGITVHSSVDSFNNPFTNVYVTNAQNHNVQKFTSDGKLLTQWGEYGMSAKQFRYPSGIATDSQGNVYVADTYNWRIQKFDPNGNFLVQWTSSWPSGIATDFSDNIYVISLSRCSIEKFTSEGILLTQWGGCGKEEGTFKSPFRINVGPDEEIYVSDTGNNRVQVFGSALIDDEDVDGIPDSADNCPEVSNPDQDDDDQDGIGNQCDGCPYDPDNDADGDGFCADVDNCPKDSNSDQADRDGDGKGDACDDCDDRPITGTISPSVTVLWPPNHRMIPVDIEVSGLVQHNLTEMGIGSVTIVERNKEGDNIYSANNFEPDFKITGALSLNLRSERAGLSQGRTYIITVTAKDCSGSYNLTTEVIVPHDKSSKMAICHKGKTIYVNDAAVKAHLRHGDHLGNCQ